MRALVLALAIACDAGPELERLPAPPSAPSLMPAERPPPPPPPPPPMHSERAGPPPEIARVIGDGSGAPVAWKVTFYELGHRARRGRTFMGLSIRSTRVLDAATSQRVVAHLREKIYWDGDVGGFTATSLGIRVEGASATLDVVYNDGHVFLTEADHDGPFAIVHERWPEELEATR